MKMFLTVFVFVFLFLLFVCLFVFWLIKEMTTGSLFVCFWLIMKGNDYYSLSYEKFSRTA